MIRLIVLSEINEIKPLMRYDYLSISEDTEGIDFSIWSKPQALRILARNNPCNKGAMAKIVIQCVFVSPICSLLQSHTNQNVHQSHHHTHVKRTVVHNRIYTVTHTDY